MPNQTSNTDLASVTVRKLSRSKTTPDVERPEVELNGKSSENATCEIKLTHCNYFFQSKRLYSNESPSRFSIKEWLLIVCLVLYIMVMVWIFFSSPLPYEKGVFRNGSYPLSNGKYQSMDYASKRQLEHWSHEANLIMLKIFIYET